MKEKGRLAPAFFIMEIIIFCTKGNKKSSVKTLPSPVVLYYNISLCFLF